jgi:GTPase
MFVDEIKIHLKAGRGGNGVERWLHLKGKEYSGPAGGNGGKGGDVIARAVRDIGILAKYRNKKEISAPNGDAGQSRSKEGANGEDQYVDFPVGSVITNLRTRKVVELLKEGEEVVLLKGGNGGLGNEHFKSSTNVRPKQWTPGKNGQEADFLIELNLIVDVGLVGLPNAGKSSLLNAISNANAKVGSYQFTTLDPNLGEVFGFIFADIPGIIEGASEGKGLGHKFLKHIKRTKALLHCISLEHEKPIEAYKTIRKELEKYGEGLVEKQEIIVLTKTDIVDEKVLSGRIKEFKKMGTEPLAVSVLDDNQIKNFTDSVIKKLRELES